MNFIDVAHSYGKGQAEEAVGTFLSGYAHREKLFINTKLSDFTNPQGSAKQVYDQFEERVRTSLGRMKTDYLDLVMWPHGAQGPRLPEARGGAGRAEEAPGEGARPLLRDVQPPELQGGRARPSSTTASTTSSSP